MVALIVDYLRAPAFCQAKARTVEVISTGGAGAPPTADLDWYMVLKSQEDYNIIERRRTKVTIGLKKPKEEVVKP